MRVLLKHVVPLVRPNDIVRALISINPQLFELPDVLFDRLSQGPLLEGHQIGDPLA